jgi:hypothetical protein
MNTTVIYLTDNQLDEKIYRLCQKNILQSIGDLPLISVSHQPIDFGTNICVGVLPRNSLTINIQMMKALEIVKTKYIAIAEHDCLYSPEHFSFIPPNDNLSWYNENVWLMQLYSAGHPECNGMFSIFPGRKANSQLICTTDMMVKTTQARIEMMGDPAWMIKHPSGRIGEAGHMDYDHAMRLASGKSVRHIKAKLKDYIEQYQGATWQTKIPNIDIRHEQNFTKNRRGRKRCYELPYWGTMAEVLNKNYDA